MNPLDKMPTADDLIALLQKDVLSTDINIQDLRYAIYLRKSTDDPDKQVRSIEDQLVECKRLAESLKIIVLKENIIEERESAKEPNIRPKFRQLLNRIIDGELDGIISWHPNRLSRNMREAGEIIDLLDKNIIKDLKFASHTFINDPSGKMMLGIVFVMAKQYSDQLSLDVKRGNRESILSGSYINKSKHGYRKDKNQHLEPDGNNFALIKEGFRMRLRGDTFVTIAKYLNNAGYTRTNAENGKTIPTKFSKQTVEKIMKDPVYTGVLKYGDNTVKLQELYDFIPMITIEEYYKINKYDVYSGEFKTKKSRKNSDTRVADLLPDRVYCAYCNELMQATVNQGNTKKYYNFKCTTDTCVRFNKGTRAKVIVDFVIKYLETKPFTSKEAYSSYKQEIIRIQNLGLAELNSQILSAKRKLGLDDDTLKVIKTNIAKENDPEVIAIQKDELKRLEKEMEETKELIQQLLAKRTNISKSPITFQEFTEIMDSIPNRIQKVQSTTELNAIISKIFSNFYVFPKNIDKYGLNSPFNELEGTKVPYGAR